MPDRNGEQSPSSPEDRGGSPAKRGFTERGEPLARQLWEEVRGGAQHFHLPNRRRPVGRVRQFFHGVSLPFHLAGALLADAVARKRYLSVGLLQTVAALALALSCCMGSVKETGREATKQERAERRVERALVEAAQARKEAQEARDPAKKQEAERRADRALAKAARSQKKAEEARQVRESRDSALLAPPVDVADAGTVLPERQEHAMAAPLGQDAGREAPSAPEVAAPALAGTEGPDVEDLEDLEDLEDAERIQKHLQAVEAAAQGDAGTSLAEAIVALALEAARLSARAEGDGRSFEEAMADGGTAVPGGGSPPRRAPDAIGQGPAVQVELDRPWWTVKGFSLTDLAFWLTLFAALQISQWVVIALSREYHDAISRDLSLLTEVRPEDEEVQPRVRVDFAWMRKKLKRRWRAFFLFALGFPAMLLLTLPLLCNGTALSVLSTAWGAYWLVVFTAAKSARAWESSEPPHPPWFLRAWTWLTTRVPGLRWGFLQRYGAFWTRRTQEVLAPVATVERHPWSFAGLALVRFIGAFPPMKFFIRPLIPVASAHLLAEETAAREALVPPAEPPVIPAGETGA